MKRVGGLDIDEDLPFTRREWLAERVGWGFLFLLILAGLAGLFGSGAASQRTMAAPDGSVSVKFASIVRQESPQSIEVRLHRPELERRVTFSDQLLATWSIESVTPEPDTVVAGDGHITFHFIGQGQGRIRFDYKPERPGVVEGFMSLGGQSMKLKQLCLP